MKFIALFAAFLISISSFAQDLINQNDANGLKNGVWKGIYPDSQRKRYEGTFAHGKEVGIFKYFDDTKAGPVIATREFNANDKSAYTIFYNQKGNKVSEGKVVDKNYEGEWKYYHLDSKIVMTREFYKNGKLEGVREVFYPNGKSAEIATYINGIKNGPYKSIAENGVVLEDVNYVEGEMHGTAIYREADGKIVSKGPFVHGLKKGVWEFYENGKLKLKEKYPVRKKFKKGAPRK